jgi:hypothetical protein
MTTTTKAQTPLAFKGPKAGVSNLLATSWVIKPGHAPALREAMTRFLGLTTADRVTRVFIPTGVHAANLSIWDNDRRFWFQVSFDTDFDPYMDDIFKLSNNGSFHFDIFKHLVDGAEDRGLTQATWTASDFKSMALAHEVETLAYLVTVADITTGETVKAQRLMKSFQKVLDDPKAAAALQNPALRPLLDEAAA